MGVSMMRRAGLMTLPGVFLIVFIQAAPAPDPPGRPGDTVEPLPGLSLAIHPAGLQRLARGGVASLVVDLDAQLAVDDASVTITLPDEIAFTDGSKQRSWRPDLAHGRTIGVPVDLLAGRDGLFSIRVEATATYRGATIRRGLTHDLRIGVERPRSPRRHGAVEFRGVSSGAGGRP
jgi:hypothetical protein